MFIEWRGRFNKYALEKIAFNSNRKYRLFLYFLISFFICIFLGKKQIFIYFQF